MRDFLVASIIFGSLPLIVIRPYIGILMWCWVSYMNPHRLTWGFMYDMPVGMIIGSATIAAWLFSREDKRIPWNAISITMLVLVLWTGVTTIFAVSPDAAFAKLTEFSKIILMTLITMSLMRSRERLRLLIWAIVLSIGYFSVKGGIFTILTGGQYRVWGPPGSNIEDNNALAVATLMIVPLMVYLARTSARRWVKIGLYTAAFLSVASVIGTYSRGGFLGLLALALILWWRSKRRAVLGFVYVAVLAGGLAFVPQKWIERMYTIEDYQGDASAEGRLAIWGHALRIASVRPIVGGGFGAFENADLYERLSPNIIRRNVHSIYFEMLGTQGYVGLALFLLLGAAGFWTANGIRKKTRGIPELADEYKLAGMVQCSLVSFAVSGAFQNLSTFDLYYHLVAMLALARYIVVHRQTDQDKAGVRSLTGQSRLWPASSLATTGAPPSYLRRK